MARCTAKRASVGACSREKPPKATAGSSRAARSAQSRRKRRWSGRMSLSRNSRLPPRAVEASRLRPIDRPSFAGRVISRTGRAMARILWVSRSVSAASRVPSSSTTISTAPSTEAASSSSRASRSDGSSRRKGISTETAGRAVFHAGLSAVFARTLMPSLPTVRAGPGVSGPRPARRRRSERARPRRRRRPRSWRRASVRQSRRWRAASTPPGP